MQLQFSLSRSKHLCYYLLNEEDIKEVMRTGILRSCHHRFGVTILSEDLREDIPPQGAKFREHCPEGTCGRRIGPAGTERASTARPGISPPARAGTQVPLGTCKGSPQKSWANHQESTWLKECFALPQKAP